MQALALIYVTDGTAAPSRKEGDGKTMERLFLGRVFQI